MALVYSSSYGNEDIVLLTNSSDSLGVFTSHCGPALDLLMNAQHVQIAYTKAIDESLNLILTSY